MSYTSDNEKSSFNFHFEVTLSLHFNLLEQDYDVQNKHHLMNQIMNLDPVFFINKIIHDNAEILEAQWNRDLFSLSFIFATTFKDKMEVAEHFLNLNLEDILIHKDCENNGWTLIENSEIIGIVDYRDNEIIVKSANIDTLDLDFQDMDLS